MNVSESNLKFEYLYRDAGNYKQFGFVVLRNPKGISVDEAVIAIRKTLIDSEFFDPFKVAVPLLSVHEFNHELDHEWYEFEKFSITDEAPTLSVELDSFLKRFE